MRRRRCITIDCWDTLLMDSQELDSEINEAIVEWLSKVDGNLSIAQLVEAVRMESEEFSRKIARADCILTPRNRLKSLLRLIGKNTELIHDAMLQDPLRRIDSSIRNAPPKLTPWASEFLHHTHENQLPVCMISNTGWISSTSVKQVFSDLGLTEFFAGWLFSGDGYRPKPNPEMFHAALSDLELTEHEVIHIGDQGKTDGVGAIAAGIRPIIIGNPCRESEASGGAAIADSMLFVTSLKDAWARIIYAVRQGEF